jgi:YVTN family beta-propeller protein
MPIFPSITRLRFLRFKSPFPTAVAAAMLIALTARGAAPQTPPITADNWGAFTAPVYGAHEAAPYSSADLFAGPLKFGDGRYYHGVLPNGRIVDPAGQTVQIGMNPLGAVLTPDGAFLITSNDDEREDEFPSLRSTLNQGGFSLTVVRTWDMQVVSQFSCGPVFIGLQVSGAGPYTVYASGGPANCVKVYSLSTQGILTDNGTRIAIPPILPASAGYVSHYTPGAALLAKGKPLPSGIDRHGAAITFPAGSALSPDGRFLYVACNGDNSLAVIDTSSNRLVHQVPVGYFPYTVAVSTDGKRVMVSNWGIQEYRFLGASYAPDSGDLIDLERIGPDTSQGIDRFFYVPGVRPPVRNEAGTSYSNSSSISLIVADEANREWRPREEIAEGRPLDALYQVGDTHPSALALIRRRGKEVLYVAKANTDRLGLIALDGDAGRAMADFDLSPVSIALRHGQKVNGAYPNALVASPDGSRLYVAEAGLNSVAVLDTSDPLHPDLLGRFPTGWYPSALALASGPHGTLYVIDAYGVGEDLDPALNAKRRAGAPFPSGIVETFGAGKKHSEDADPFVDSNYVFGAAQKVDVDRIDLGNATVMRHNVAYHPPQRVGVVPIGGRPSARIKHVFFILHENKTVDSLLGADGAHFGPFVSTRFITHSGQAIDDTQYTDVDPNTRLLATRFATALNYYSDAEESDAGHQYCASGTASDYTEKTLLVKSGRGLLAQKDYDAEDYPAGGYLFNNAARNGVSFKDYGDMVRIAGMDKGDSQPTRTDDPMSGNAGLPGLDPEGLHIPRPLTNVGDVDSPTHGVGLSFFLNVPMLAVLGSRNPDGEARIDRDYPGYNFNISDQRRAKEFCRDFDRMVKHGTLPALCYIYQPNDHTGSLKTPNKKEFAATGMQQVADGDVGLGMVVDHILHSPIYYDPKTRTGSAIFITWDDAQSTRDHIHPHRTPLIVVSPFARPGYVGAHHYSTASIVKTEELLLGLPPNNLGDLFATDLRDLFQETYNGITLGADSVTRQVRYTPSSEGRRIWALANHLDTSGPDRDSQRLGALNRLAARADTLHRAASRRHHVHSRTYLLAQAHLYTRAMSLVAAAKPADGD